MLLMALSLSASSGPAEDQPFFPKYHIRPPAGHVNDPNGEAAPNQPVFKDKTLTLTLTKKKPVNHPPKVPAPAASPRHRPTAHPAPPPPADASSKPDYTYTVAHA